MARWRRPVRACVALGTIALSGSGAAAQEQAFPSRRVDIAVSVGTGATVTVREEYALDRRLSNARFEFLQDACSRVGSISATIDDRPLPLVAAHRGPWTLLNSTDADAAADGRSLRLQYDVQLAGSLATVPIVLPAAMLDRDRGVRGADVTLQVVFVDDRGLAAVLLPRLDPVAGSTAWRARLSAIPSIVRLRMPSIQPSICDRALAGPTGGLEWRFWIFVATMAVWIPVYFWWFGRRDDSG